MADTTATPSPVVELDTCRDSEASLALHWWVREATREAFTHTPHPALPRLDKRVIKEGVRWLAEKLMEGGYLRVARVNNDMAGFALLAPGEGNIVHYVYVRSTERRLGVGRRLISDLIRTPWVFTIASPMGWAFVRALMRAGACPAVYNPYLLYRIMAESVVSPTTYPEVTHGIPEDRNAFRAAAPHPA